MNEFDLIVKYLEKRGSKVVDVCYYNEQINAVAADDSKYIGQGQNFSEKGSYFFGNVNIVSVISGTVVLTNRNVIVTSLKSLLRGTDEVGWIVYRSGVNLEMSLMGDGDYQGNKRLYGVGFNNIHVNIEGFGVATTFTVSVMCNGYLFILK